MGGLREDLGCGGGESGGSGDCQPEKREDDGDVMGGLSITKSGRPPAQSPSPRPGSGGRPISGVARHCVGDGPCPQRGDQALTVREVRPDRRFCREDGPSGPFQGRCATKRTRPHSSFICWWSFIHWSTDETIQWSDFVRLRFFWTIVGTLRNRFLRRDICIVLRFSGTGIHLTVVAPPIRFPLSFGLKHFSDGGLPNG